MRSRPRLLIPLLVAALTSLPSVLWISASTASAATDQLVAPRGGGHVVMPTLPAARALEARRAATFAPLRSTPTTPLMTYHGGTGGIGVLTGQPKVYLVFWGSQWGRQTLTSGVTSFPVSADPSREAVDLERFFAGLGSNGESWSAISTQYCQGTNGARAHMSTDPGTGATSCTRKNWAHVGYPRGGVLAGVWADGSSAAPAAASQAQLASEAFSAAQHFGNTSPASNRSTEYFIVSPTGTDPDHWKSTNYGFCAWHDFVGDPTLLGSAPNALNTSAGLVSFTNFPYLTDEAQACGSYYVNSDGSGSAPVPGDSNPITNGSDDGVTIVGGHEYAEAITDAAPVQTPFEMTGGWYTDNTANTQGEVGAELADLCAWGAGGSGSADAVNLNLLTGTFAVQALWSNADDGCVSSDSIVTMAKLGTHRLVGPSVDLVPSASTTATNPNLRWGATGLPLGVSINRTTGEISGSTAPGSWAIKVTATDANEVTASRQLTLVVAGTASLVRS